MAEELATGSSAALPPGRWVVRVLAAQGDLAYSVKRTIRVR